MVARAAGLDVEGVFTVIAAADEVVVDGGQPAPADATIGFQAASGVDQPPELLTNQAEIQRVTDEEYPRNLRDAGVDGTVTIRIRLYATGEVESMELVVGRGSGNDLLDAAALRVVQRVFRFSPAIHDGEPENVVFVWDITFEASPT